MADSHDEPMRALLVQAHGQEGPLYMRLIGLFVITVASIVASGAMLHVKAIWDSRNPLGRFLRTFSAGNVLCLGIVHIGPYAYENFNRLEQRVGFYMDFQFGGIAVTFGFLVMFVLMGVAQGLGKDDDPSNHSIGKEGGYSVGKGGVATSVFPEGIEGGKAALDVSDLESGSGKTASDLGYAPGRSDFLKFMTEQMGMVFFELGVVVHSILVGLRLGSKRYYGVETTRTYLIAVIFHQLLESAALGIYISSKQIGFVKGWGLSILAQLMFPVGVAIGIGVIGFFNPDSISVLTARGILNGIAAGVLIYVSTIAIVAQEVRKEALLLLPKRWHRAMVYVGFVCGTFTMSLISIWA